MRPVKIAAIVFLLAGIAWYAKKSPVAAHKTHSNIGVFGAPSAGSRELGLALFSAASGRPPAKTDLMDADDLTFVEYNVNQLHLSQTLFKSLPPSDFRRFYQALQCLDGVIFTVERETAPNRSVVDQCLTAKAAGVPELFVYVWSSGKPAATSDAAILSLFAECGYAPANIHLVQGQAQRQASGMVSYGDVSALLRLVADEIAPKAQDASAAFVMTIEDVYNIPARGTIVAGRVAAGEVKTRTELVAIGLGRELKTSALSIEMFQRKLAVARAGDLVGITLDGISRGELVRGMILTDPDIARQASNFSVRIKAAPETENRDAAASGREDEYMLFTGATALPVKVKFLPGRSAAIAASEPVPLIKGWSVVLRKEDKIAAIGVIE